MAEAETAPAEPSARARRDWNGVAAIIASLVGLLALAVSAYTASVQREQVRAQVWTRLLFQRSDTDTSLIVTNKGVGPARVQSLRFYVDGRAQPDWEHVFAALRFKPPDYEQSSLNGSVLAAGERLDFLKFRHAPDWSAFLDSAQGRLKMRTCYCSVLDECLLIDQRLPHHAHGTASEELSPVARCDRVEAEEFDN